MHTSRLKSRPVSRFSPQFVRRLSSWLLLSTVLTVGSSTARSANYYWDADGNLAGDNTVTGTGLGGNGIWDTSSLLWWDGTNPLVAWPNLAADTATFAGVGGVVQLGAPITVGTLTFNTAGFNITGDGTAGTNTLTLGGSAAVQVNVAGSDSINAVIAGSSGLNLSSSTTGTLVLTNTANLFSGGVTISSGTLNILADGSLGNAANGITFNGTTGGLTLAQSMALAATRTLTLTGSTTATVTSGNNANIAILGQITGTGNLTLVNTGTSFLTSAGNNFSGVLWAQNGTVSVESLADPAGAGNVKLGNLTTAGVFQWASGATTGLTLTNRAVELAGTTGGATIDSSAIVAANSLTINTLTYSGAGAKALTLTGNNTGTNILNGNIVNNGANVDSLTKSGTGLWVLNGTNTYSGNTTIGSGTLRATTGSSLGTAASSIVFTSSSGSNLILLELRNDSTTNFQAKIGANSGTNETIYVDRAIGGTGSNGTMTLGAVSQSTPTAGFFVIGDHGYGLSLGINTVVHHSTAATTNTLNLTNDLGSPGFVAPGFQNGVVTLAGITSDGVANTGGVTQTLQGWGEYVVGAVSSPNGANLVLNVTKSGAGLLTFNGSNTGWTNGTLTMSGGTTRLSGASPIGTATFTMGGGLLELRNDSSTNVATNIAGVSAASTLVVDHTIGATSSGNTMTIGTVLGSASQTLNIVGDRGNALTTGAVTINSAFTLTLANYLSAPGYAATGYTAGVVTLGSVTNASGVVGTLALGGVGDYAAFNGNVSNTGGGTLNIAKSALGITTFSGANTNWTAGTLTSSGGTTTIDATNLNAIGTASLNGSGGMLEIRGAAGTSGASWTGKALTMGGSFTLDVDPLVGAGTTGQTVNLGALNGATFTESIISSHGYNLTFNGAATTAAAATLANLGNGTVTFAGGITSTAAAAWTLGGNGDYNVTGNITAATTAITKSGQGTLTISGAANAYAGNFIANSGIIRVLNATGFGGAGAGTLTMLGNAGAGMGLGLDLRNNGSMDLSGRALTRTYNTVFNVDNNGSGTNGTVTLGSGLSMQDNGWSATASGANGYSLKFGAGAAANVAIAAGGIGYTFYNYIPSISGSGNVEFAGGLTWVNTASTGTLALSGTGDYLVSGPLTYTTGGTTDTLNKNGVGTLTLSGNSSTTWNNAAAILTITNGITRVTTGNSLGGASAKVNLGPGTLDLRSDATMTTLPIVTIAANNAFINVDRAVGGAGTGATHTLGGVSLGAFTLFTTGGGNSGGNAYNLNTGTLTMTGTNTIINNIGNGGTLTIPTIAGTQATTFSGAGSTVVTGTAASLLGTITKTGTGTVTFQESAAGANTTGNLTVNAGTLVADYGAGATNAIFTGTGTLTLGGGALQIKGATAGNTTQTLGNVTVNAGLGKITVTPQGSGTTTLGLGTLTTTATGGQLLVTAAGNAIVQFNQNLSTATTLNGRAVFTDGTNYDWLANTGVNTTSIPYNAYTDISGTTVTVANTLNDSINSANANETTTWGASVATNSLRINAAAAGQSLALGAFNLTSTNGGLLFSGSNAYTISGTSITTGLKSGIATTSDLIINNYGTGILTISAPVIHANGVDTLTVGGTGTTIMGNATLGSIGTYTGTTNVNGGTLQLATGTTSLGAAASNTGLAVSSGTFDVNGVAVAIGSFSGGYAGTVDNSNASPVTITIGTGNGTGTFLGTIKNTGGALSIVKTGTGSMTLGDVNGMSSLAFTGNLTINGNSTLTVAVPLADTAGTNINLGTTTSTDAPNFTYTGNTNLTLSNRQFDLSGVSNGTITASGVSGQNGTAGVLTINGNLLLDGTGNKTLTLGGTAGNVVNGGTVSGITGSGAVSLINTFAGTIGVNNPNSITLGVAVTGSGGWALTGANTFSGGLTMSSSGILRGTVGNGAASGSFGGSGNLITMSAGTLDLRSDTSQNFGNNITWLTNNIIINADRAPGGSGYGQIMTLGTITETTTGKTLTVQNLNNNGVSNQNQGYNSVTGYGLRLAGLNLNTTGTTTVNNVMGSPGAATFAMPTIGNGVAGALVIDNVAAAANLGTTTLTIGVATVISNGVTIIPGDITQAAGGATPTVLGVNFNGNGTLILGGTTATNAFSGGLTIGSANAVVRATTQYSLGTGNVTLSTGTIGGTLEVRNDSNVTYGNNIVLNSTTAATGKLNVGESINGSGGHANNFTFGTLVFQGVTANALTVAGISGSSNNSGDSVTFGGVNLNGNFSGTVTNSLLLPGLLNLGNVTSSATTGVQTLTVGGAGMSTVGDLTNGITGGTVAITYSGSGILDLNRTTATTSGAGGYTGGLNLGGGTVRVSNAFGLGQASNLVTFTATAALEVRTDTDISYGNTLAIGSTGSVLSLGQLPGGTGTTGGYGKTVTFAALAPNQTAKILTVNGIQGTTASEGYSLRIQNVNVGGIGTQTAGETVQITNNLPLTGSVVLDAITNNSNVAGTNLLTLAGSGAFTVTGDITDSAVAGVKTSLTYSGSGFLNLAGTAASNYSGGFKISSGVVRATTQYSLGTGTINLGGGTLEIRNDSDVPYNNAISLSANTSVTVGQSPGGTGATGGYGKTVTLGALTPTATGFTLTLAGIGGTSASNGYNVVLGAVTSNVAALGITNNMPIPSTLTVASVTNGSATNSVLTFGGPSGVTSITGDITNGGGGGTLGIVGGGAVGNVLVLAGTAATNYSGGLTVGNTTNNATQGTVRATTQFSLGANTGVAATSNAVLLRNATLDLRNDSNVSYSNPITVDSTFNVGLNADRAVGGSGIGNTVTFNGGMAFTSATQSRILTITSGNNYNLTLTGTATALGTTAITSATVSATNEILNNASGIFTIGDGVAGHFAYTNTGATATTQKFSGQGYTVIAGDITQGAGALTVGIGGTSNGGFLDLSQVNMDAPAATYTGGVTFFGASTAKVVDPKNLGAANNLINFTVTGGTLQVRSNGTGNNGTIAFGNPVTLSAASTGTSIIDVGSNTANTGNTIAFGLLSNGTGATGNILIVNGQNGYGASFTGLTLPNGAGQNTTITANAPVTITGNVTNAITPVLAHFDTLFLDGTVGGNIQGTITDSSTGGVTVGNGDTRLTKNGTGTWTLSSPGNTFIGPTQINLGTLKSGATNAIGTASAVTITATGANQFATLDLNGNNQTLSSVLVMGGSTATSTPQVLLGNGNLILSNATTAFSYPGTNAPLAAIISANGGAGSVQLGVANAVFNVVRSATNVVSTGNPFAADVIITAPVTDSGFGGLAKLGTGVLQLASASNTINGVADVQAGTLSVGSLPDASSLKLGLTTVGGIFQYIGTSPLVFNTRVITLNGSTGGGTLDSSAVNAANTITINSGLANAAGVKTLTLTGSNTGSNTFASVIGNATDASALALTKTGTGTWVLSNTETYTGATTVSAGTLNVTGAFGNTAIAVSGGTLSLQGAGAVSQNTITVSGTGNLVQSGAGTITGTAAVTLTSGTASVTLSGNNSYSGATTISGGTNSTITITNANGGGTGQLTTATGATTPVFNLHIDGAGSNGAITLSNPSFAGNSGVNATYDVNNNGGGTTGNVIRFAGTSTGIGTSTYSFTGGNGYSLYIENLRATAGAVGTQTLNPTTTNVTVNTLTTSHTSGTDIWALDGTSSGNFISGAITQGTSTNKFQLNKTNTSTWTITGAGSADTWTGGLNVQNGTIRLAGGDDRLPTSGNVVTLGNGATSGKLIIGGDATGGTGAGTQHTQTFNQTTATALLATSGTGLLNAIVGGSAGGTSSGTPANNSTLSLNVGTGFLQTYSGLIGWDGQGAVGFQNNINLIKSGGGTLALTADLSNWTGTQVDAPGTGLGADATRPELVVTGGVLRLANTATINTVIRNTGGVIDDQGATYGSNYLLIVTGGLIALSNTTDSFSNSGITATSHGVAALNIPGNTGVVNYAGSDMYLGAIGARIFSNSPLAPGSGNTYRLGGGAPWNALGTASVGGSGGYLQIASSILTGNNAVVIGDNGTYNGGGGLFGSLSTVEFTTAQSFTGTLSILGGTLQFTNIGQLGSPAVAANSILLDGGSLNNGFNAILRWAPGNTTDLSARIGIVSGGTIDTGSNTVTFASALGNANAGTGGFNKIGNGTLILAKAGTYAGPTGVTQGTLTVDLDAAVSDDVVPNTSALLLGGGNLGVKGSGGTTTHSQTFNGTTFASGASTITPTLSAVSAQLPNLTVSLGSLTHNVGATGNIVFTTGNTTATNTVLNQSSIATTNTLIADSNGVAYLTFGTSATSVRDWAVTGATTASNIVQAPGAGFYTAATATTATGNADMGALSPTLTGAVGDNAITSIRFDNAGARTLTLNGATSTFSVGGILVTSNVGNNATIIAGTGTIQGPNGGAGELVIHDWDTASNLSMNVAIGGTGGLTKSGPGTVILTVANTYSGPTTINGGILEFRAQNEYGTTSGFTLNGGTFNWNTAGTALPKTFTLGLNGGGINSIGGGSTTVGTAGDVLGFLGAGARTLNLTTGVSDRRTDFLFIIGDNGGPTSLNVGSLAGAGGTSSVRLSANNTYTGTTTIFQGTLDLNNAGALPGGLGGPTLTSSNTGGGNLIFNGGTGTNRAILQLSTLSGDFYRPLGSGFDQVQFLGNGGFANSNSGTTRIVNIGNGTSITWGSTFFLPTGGQLEFGVGATNVPAAGAIDFQNNLALGTVARIVDVSDNTQGAAASGVDAILSGDLTGGVGGALTKAGAGVLKLTGNNSAGTDANSATAVNAGYLLFANTAAIPGAGASNRTVTVGAAAGVVLSGASDIQSLLSRLVTTSGGSAMLDTSNTSVNAVIDMSSFGTLSLGAYSDQGGTPVYYGGSILPNATTYRFAAVTEASKGGQGAAATAVQRNTNLLVLTRQNVLTGGNAANFGNGTVYLTNTNNYTGGTAENGSQANIGIGNDAALGTGLLTISNTTSFIGSVNGDHTVSNNLKTLAAGNFVVTGTTTADAIANPGSLTFLGTLNTTGTVILFARGNNPIFLGDVAPGNSFDMQNNTGAGVFSMLTLPAGGTNKTFTSARFANTVTLLIDSDRSLGAVPAAATTNLTFNAGAGILQVQPGTAAVTLSGNRNIAITSNIASTYNVPGGTVSIAGVTTGGVVTNTSLTIPGIISGGGTSTASKTGLGTLVLRGINTFTATGGNGFQIVAGALQLDYANASGAGAILNNTTPMQLTLGTSTAGNLSAGGTLLLSNGNTAATQNFSTTVTTSKDNFITLNSTGGALTLGLGTTITRVVGGTVNFNGNFLSSATVNSSFAAVNGILPGATWGGSNLVAASGSALSVYSAYITPAGAAPTIASATATNVRIDNTSSGISVLGSTGATPTDINTLTFSDTVARTIGVGTGNTLRLGTVGMILSGSGSGALTIGATGVAGSLVAGGTTANASGEVIFANYSASGMTVNSVIANNGTGTTTIAKSGTGVVTLAGNNTFTGSIFVNNGVLEFSDGGASKNLGNATVAATNILMNGGALRYTGTANNTNIFGVTFNGISAVDVPNTTGTNALTMGTTTALSGTTGIAGVVGILQKTGAGGLTLGGNVDNANLSVEVVGGTLNLGKASTSAIHAVSGGVAGAALVVDSGATAKITSASGDQIFDGSSVVVKSGGTFDLNGNSEAIDGLAGAGTGLVTSATAATLSLGGSAANAAATNNQANISGNTVAAANAGVASSGLNNFAGVIGGNLSLTKYGAGTQILGGSNILTLASQNTYSGVTLISAGTLKLAVLNALPFGSGKSDVTITGNTVINAVVVPGTLDLGGFDQAINGLNSSTGGYVTNTIPLVWGGTTWSAAAGTATLTVGNNNAGGSFNGTFQDGLTIVPNLGTGAGSGTIGTMALTKTGTGTQVLSGANTATGALTVNLGEVDLNATGTNAWSGSAVVAGGVLKLLQSNQIADGKSITVSGGALEMNGRNETVAGVALTGGSILDTPAGGTLVSASNYDLQSGSASAVLAGATVTVGAVKSGAGTVTLSGANTYSAPTAINGGVLSIIASNNLGDGSSTNTIAIAGGTLRSTGASVDLTANRAVSIGAGGATLDVTGSNSLQVSGVVSAGSTDTLTKVGTGKAILSATNTYTGDTNVNEGTLVVSGSISGSVTVAGSATLASGNNTTSLVQGINLQAGGVLAPGDSGDASGTTTIGALKANGATVDLGSAGTAASLKIELGGTTGGTLYDQLQLGSGSTLNLNNVNLVLSVANNYNPNTATDASFNGTTLDITTGQKFFLVLGSSQAVGGTQGFFANQGAADPNLPGYGTISLAGQVFAISYDANAGLGTFSGGHDVALLAIPEPNSLAMLAGSLSMALGLQRFRRRRI